MRPRFMQCGHRRIQFVKDQNIADFTATAMAKLARLQKSPTYNNFVTPDAIEAFASVEGSVFAGKPLKKGKPCANPATK